MLIHVDTVILSFERQEETQQAIASALAQQGVHGEVIVVDQGSSEPCVSALRALAAEETRIRLDLQPENLGVPGGRRRGIDLSSAPFVAFLDNDATFETEDALTRAVAALETRPAVGAASFLVLLSSTQNLDDLSWVHRLDWKYRAAENFLAAQFVGAGFMLRKDAYQATPGLHAPLFFYWEELDLSYALMSEGFDVLHLGEVAVLHNVSPERRVTWDGGRFYYYVRNRIAIERKYLGSRRAAVFAVWYLVSGLRYRRLRDVLRAFRDSRNLYSRPYGVMSRVGREKVRELTPSIRDRAALAVAKLRVGR